MRLKLKTLLAYSDDLFDTEYRPAIEKRIAEDDAASHVIDRIRTVVRNPDLPVPGRYGEKEEMSANLVAAYLDGLLSDVEHSRFETICLRSDIYLAETACSHQILSTILGQPANVSRDCRLRLYAIPRHRKRLSQAPPVSYEAEDPQSNMKTEPEPCKKRRITVTTRENTVSQSMPEQEPPPDGAESASQSAKTIARFTTGKISRLGQAFAHRKRHRTIMMVCSLALFFLCVSAFLLTHLKPRQPDKGVAQQQSLATASNILTSDEENPNHQRWDEHKNFWGQRDTTPTSAGNAAPSLFETEWAAHTGTIYSLNEPPSVVMDYLPGQSNVPPQVPHPSGLAPGNLMPSVQAGMGLPLASPLGFADESPRMLQQSPTQQHPTQHNPLHHSNSQTTISMANTSIAPRPMPGNTMPNGLLGSQGQPPPAQAAQRHIEATIQLIDDHGSVPSVNQRMGYSLPAVQPATWGTDAPSNNSRENTPTGPNHQTAFPQGNQAIGLVSYADPGHPNIPPPLIEPHWNATNHGGFEQVHDTPQASGISHASLASPPLRLPENIAGSNNATATHQRRLMSGENIATSGFSTLILGTEDLALVRETPDTEWSWLPLSKQLANDIVLVPAPFRAAFTFPNGITVETEGDTRVQILPDDEAGRPTLAFDCGYLTIYATGSHQVSGIPQSLRIVTPVGGGVLRFTDTNSFVTISSENKTTVKLLKVTRPYESVTANPLLHRGNLDNHVVYCPNLISFPAEGKTIYWQKDGNSVEWRLATVSIFPMDTETHIPPILVHNTNNLIVAPTVVWPALVSHDGRIPISKLDLKNQFVTMPHTFYPTPSKTWLLK